MQIQRLSRSRINNDAWNDCVSRSTTPLIYGYSWYLDTVTDLPNWKWEGLAILIPTGSYEAVMPVPLRRKSGIWVVHQPLFCQFLGVYGATVTAEMAEAFAQYLLNHYQYGSILQLAGRLESGVFRQLPFRTQPAHTQLLSLRGSYAVIRASYSADTRRHLRQAEASHWDIKESDDVQSLLKLFREYHAGQIPGGVGQWAYGLFSRLFEVLKSRGIVTLQYALREGKAEGGAIFVRLDNRIIYLFNAATETGRRYHARTLLIDRMIQEAAGQEDILFDFESPEVASVQQFYEGFGAKPSPYWVIRWNQLPSWAKVGLALKQHVQALLPKPKRRP
jgi:hypothetical protein